MNQLIFFNSELLQSDVLHLELDDFYQMGIMFLQLCQSLSILFFYFTESEELYWLFLYFLLILQQQIQKRHEKFFLLRYHVGYILPLLPNLRQLPQCIDYPRNYMNNQGQLGQVISKIQGFSVFMANSAVHQYCLIRYKQGNMQLLPSNYQPLVSH